MEDEDDPTDFAWYRNTSIQRSNKGQRNSITCSIFFNFEILVMLLILIAGILVNFFFIPPLVNFIQQLGNSQSLKRDLESLNLLLVLFAVICGFLTKLNGNVDDSNDHNTLLNDNWVRERRRWKRERRRWKKAKKDREWEQVGTGNSYEVNPSRNSYGMSDDSYENGKATQTWDEEDQEESTRIKGQRLSTHQTIENGKATQTWDEEPTTIEQQRQPTDQELESRKASQIANLNDQVQAMRHLLWAPFPPPSPPPPPKPRHWVTSTLPSSAYPPKSKPSTKPPSSPLPEMEASSKRETGESSKQGSERNKYPPSYSTIKQSQEYPRPDTTSQFIPPQPQPHPAPLPTPPATFPSNPSSHTAIVHLTPSTISGSINVHNTLKDYYCGTAPHIVNQRQSRSTPALAISPPEQTSTKFDKIPNSSPHSSSEDDSNVNFTASSNHESSKALETETTKAEQNELHPHPRWRALTESDSGRRSGIKIRRKRVGAVRRFLTAIGIPTKPSQKATAISKPRKVAVPSRAIKRLGATPVPTLGVPLWRKTKHVSYESSSNRDSPRLDDDDDESVSKRRKLDKTLSWRVRRSIGSRTKSTGGSPGPNAEA